MRDQRRRDAAPHSVAGGRLQSRPKRNATRGRAQRAPTTLPPRSSACPKQHPLPSCPIALQEKVAALRGLAGVLQSNTRHSRQRLRGDVERQSLNINQDFIQAFQGVQEVRTERWKAPCVWLLSYRRGSGCPQQRVSAAAGVRLPRLWRLFSCLGSDEAYPLDT